MTNTFCPYLVGRYDRVAAEGAPHLELGSRTAVRDVPASAEALEHIGIVFDRAKSLSIS